MKSNSCKISKAKKSGFVGLLVHRIKNVPFVSSFLVWTNTSIFLRVFFAPKSRVQQQKHKPGLWMCWSETLWSPWEVFLAVLEAHQLAQMDLGPWAGLASRSWQKSNFYKRIPSLRHTPPPHPEERDYGNSYHRKIKLQFNHLLLMPFLYWILIHF